MRISVKITKPIRKAIGGEWHNKMASAGRLMADTMEEARMFEYALTNAGYQADIQVQVYHLGWINLNDVNDMHRELGDLCTELNNTVSSKED